MSTLPINRPGKIFAVGLNYRDHVSEAAVAEPESPVLFTKWQNCLIGTNVPIVIPPGIDQVDWEAELAVIMGREARNVGVDDALDFVHGYTCMNDVSARRVQLAEGQWSRAKSFDTFGPVGPRLVPASEIPDPQVLDIRSRVNGEVMQDSNTKHMIFSVADLISFISHGITLEPGDLISTGTPGGVGSARPTPVFLRDGDVVEVEIDGIGSLVNQVRNA